MQGNVFSGADNSAGLANERNREGLRRSARREETLPVYMKVTRGSRPLHTFRTNRASCFELSNPLHNSHPRPQFRLHSLSRLCWLCRLRNLTVS
jgi:hypothetical protein